MAYYDSYGVYINCRGMFINGVKTVPTKEIMEEYNKQRFWTKVGITAQENLCWEWKTNCKGYGHFGLNGKTEPAHRIAYLFHYGVDPKEFHVCHTCDNKKCCNPKHLFLGTRSDNMQDMASKGRTSVKLGVDNNKAKLTEADIPVIIQLHKQGESYASISRKYPVSPEMVSLICRGKYWKHLNINKDAT